VTHDRSRRLGYYILKPDGTIDAKVFGKALSNECIAEFEAVIQVVLDLAPILRAFEIANLSHHELRATLQGVNNRLSNISVAPLGGIPLIHDLETEVQQRVMAFLSSAKSFLDHTEAILKRQYGGVSPEYQRFKTHTHGLYDKNFSYRFVNELRHMSQHVTLPISIFNMTMQRTDGTDELVYGSELKLDRAHLLTSWTKWKPVVKRELEKQPPQFDLLSLLDEEASWLRELCCGVFAMRADEIRRCLEYLSVLLRMIHGPIGAIPVLWVGESILPGTPPPGSEILPVEQVRRIATIMGSVPRSV
jgi:hypothetical protein